MIGLFLSKRYCFKQQKGLYLLLCFLHLLRTISIHSQRLDPFILHLATSKLNVGNESSSHIIISL